MIWRCNNTIGLAKSAFESTLRDTKKNANAIKDFIQKYSADLDKKDLKSMFFLDQHKNDDLNHVGKGIFLSALITLDVDFLPMFGDKLYNNPFDWVIALISVIKFPEGMEYICLNEILSEADSYIEDAREDHVLQIYLPESADKATYESLKWFLDKYRCDIGILIYIPKKNNSPYTIQEMLDIIHKKNSPFLVNIKEY